MKLDDYLAQHQQVPFAAVLEPVEGTPPRIRITPVAGRGCACDHSIVVGRDDITDVEPTSRTLACCGKLQRIVLVTLRDDARIPAHEAVASLIARHSAARSSDMEEPYIDPAEACQDEAIFQFKRCVNGCRNSRDPAACRERCRARLERELDVCFPP